MGYHAPSAEQVYRYIFRIAERERSLTDRFNWSLLFVNDESPVCEDFLKKYCIDLCLRTADRIRFVFFSNMPERDMQKIAVNLNYGRLRTKRGFLGTILDHIPHSNQHRRVYDFEERPWTQLRPDALYPLRNREEIRKRVNLECDLKTAIPGYGIALEFAQKLGIGRYVPCILVFNDIGQLKIDILPISNMTSSQIYDRVRYWIDTYYEANHLVLVRWTEIENNINKICNENKESLSAIRNWRSERLDLWNNLKKVTNLIHLLVTKQPHEWKKISSLEDDYDLPWSWRDKIRNFNKSLDKYEHHLIISGELFELHKRLVGLENPESFYNFFLELDNKIFPNLSMPTPIIIKQALEQLRTEPHIISPTDELKDWWQNLTFYHLSFKKFTKYRKSWIFFSRSKTPTFDLKTMSQIIHEEFHVVLSTYKKLAFSIVPNDGSNIILNVLAQYYGVKDDDITWNNSVSDYREYLIKHFQSRQDSAPFWLTDITFNLTFEECIPPIDWSESLDDFIKSKSRLNDLVYSIETDIESRNQEAKHNWIDLHFKYRDQIANILLQYSSQFSTSENDCYSVRELLLDYFMSEQTKLQNDILDKNTDSLNHKFPGKKIDTKLTSKLLKELEDYENAVNEIKYPYQKDPFIISVPIQKYITDAILISNYDVAKVSRKDELRKLLLKAIEDAKESQQEWPKVQKESLEFNPVSALCSSLKNIVGIEKLIEITSHYEGDKLLNKLEDVVRNNHTYELLENLNNQELIELAAYLSEDHESNINNHSRTNNELCEQILVNLGLLLNNLKPPLTLMSTTDREKNEKILKEKMERDDFDVFIAHNSVDKNDILEICRYLRSRGIYPWIDIEQIPPGRWFQDVIQSAIRKVKSVAIFIGKNGIGRWQAMELRSFINLCVENELPVIPVLLPSVDKIPDELLFLREKKFVKFKSKLDETNAINSLIWGITAPSERT